MAQLQALGRPVSDSTLLSIVEVYESSPWHDVARQSVPAPSQKRKSAAASVDSAKLLRLGKELLVVLARAYSRHVCSVDTEKMWLRATAKDPFVPPGKSVTATLVDALDAMAVLGTESCVLNYKFVSELLTMSKSNTVRVMLCAVERLHAMFMEVLPGCKLRYIHQVDESVLQFLQRHVSAWEKGGSASWDSFDPLGRVMLHVLCFEDFLKGAYATFIQVVTDQLEGGPPFVQRRMLHYVLEMLARKPEQECLFLDLLLSKLVDKDSKLSSDASLKLTQLLECHGGMKSVVVRRLGALLVSGVGKVQQSLHAKSSAPSKRKSRKRSTSLPSEVIPSLKSMYRAVLFLSGIHFTRNDSKATSEALKCYMSLLSFIFSRPEGDNRVRLLPIYEYDEFSRHIRCISCGLERCIGLVRHREGRFDIFDYSSGSDPSSSRTSMEQNITALYRAAHTPISFSTNISLLTLIHRVQPGESRFYNLLYERLLDVRMFEAVNRHSLLRLTWQCLSKDDDASRVAAFVKRLLQASLCLVGSGICTRLSGLCRRLLFRVPSVRSTLSPPGPEPYSPLKRDPRFSEADKAHLWECYLNRISYHPSVSAENLDFAKAPKADSSSSSPPSVFEELGIISGQLNTGDFSYTQRAYWSTHRKAAPHQLVFKEFFEHRAACDVESVRKASRSDRDSDESDDSDIDESNYIDELNGGVDSGDDEVDGVTDSATSDESASDTSADSDETTSTDSVDSYDDSDFEDSGASDSDAASSSASEEDTSSSDTSDASPPRKAQLKKPLATNGVVASKKPQAAVALKREVPKASASAAATPSVKSAKKGVRATPARGKVLPASRRSAKAAEDSTATKSQAVESVRPSKTSKKHREPSADPGREKRKKVSRLIQKATKGSFAAVSDIPGVDEFL